MNRLGRHTLTIDIETLPSLAPVDDARKALNGAKTGDEYSRTALSGDFGRILCVGFADDDGRGGVSYGCLGWDDSRQQFMCDERQLLTDFWELMCGFRPSVDRVVGHNLFDFDLKFIYKRSVVHGVRPSVELSFARYRNQPLYDTMHEWERWGYGSKISLDRLARVLNLPSSKSDGVDGSQVSQLFSAGEHEAIYNYCLRDVELTRLIYRRMTFAEDITRGADTTGGDAQFAPRELKGRESALTVY